jgi:hypothetical protein
MKRDMDLIREILFECEKQDVLLNSKIFLLDPVPILRGVGSRASIDRDSIRLNAGDTLDFMVGVGPSRSHGSDSTGLKATITWTGS